MGGIAAGPVAVSVAELRQVERLLSKADSQKCRQTFGHSGSNLGYSTALDR